MTILLVSIQTAPWAALAEGEVPVAKLEYEGTLNFFPELSGQIQGVCIICDWKLACITSGASK